MNKFIGFVFICVMAISMSSCGSDSEEVILNYDGDNVTGPFFNQGAYVTAARFPSGTTSLFNGQVLEAVDLYILEQPTNARLVILEGSANSAEPLGEITGQSLNVLTTNSWNRITLNNPLTIDGSEIWIGIDFSVSGSAQIIGCDAGPANRNGDYLFQDSDNVWTTFRDLTTTESINWNIRGVLSGS
jgi:hypothetical protein